MSSQLFSQSFSVLHGVETLELRVKEGYWSAFTTAIDAGFYKAPFPPDYTLEVSQ